MTTDKVIRILLVEDNPSDAELVKREFKRAGMSCEIRWADSKESFLKELSAYRPDVILSDYKMPSFGAVEVLTIVKERCPATPCIVVSGTIGEDLAVDMLKSGSADYVMKDRLLRLVPATNRALSEAREHAERKKAEDALAYKTMLLEANLQASIDGIVAVDSVGRAILLNKRFGELWRVPQHILDTKSEARILEHVLEQLKDSAEFSRKVSYLYAHEDEESRDEIELVDGRCFDRYSAPLHGAEGTYYGRVWYFRDITERKKADEAMRSSEGRYRALFEGVKDAIFVADPETRALVDCNKRAEELTGRTRAEILSMLADQLHPEDVANETVALFRRQAAGEAVMVESFVLAKDGGRIPVSINAAAVEIEGKKRVIGVFRDVTERKKMEEETQENAERFRRISSITSDIAYSCVATSGSGYKINWIAGATERIFGYSIDEVKAKGCWGNLVFEQDAGLFRENVTGLEPGASASCELRIRHKDGTISWILSRAECMSDPDDPTRLILHGGITDITERKKMEHELKRELDNLQKFTHLTVGRELKMAELKKEIERLKEKLGKQQ